MTVPQPAIVPGLQVERTQLAWERTAISFLTVAATLVLPHHGPLSASRTVVASAALLIAFGVAQLGRRRARRMDRSPELAVRLVGLVTVALAVVLVVMLGRFS